MDGCRNRRWDLSRRGTSRTVWHGVSTLLIEKFSGDEVTVRTTDETVVVSLGGRSHELDRRGAATLRCALDGALTERREFVHTVGTHRSNGSYVVARRGTDSAGHRKVFDRFECLWELYGSLPERFTAGDVERPGLTGSRRHLVVRHLAEHPDFDCALVARQPMTVEREAYTVGQN